MKEFEHLRVPIEFIKHATNNFSDGNFVAEGGFGKVYRGEFLHALKGHTVGAIKRLDRSKDQADFSFWREIQFLSSYKHENIISLVGICDESEEKILVYEFASNKSLDFHLHDPNLKWIQRLKICLGAACGLEYLHDHKDTQQRVLHRDIKSANILLDENWNAKIADFGLSKYGPANQEHTFLFSNANGTVGYCDPLYLKTGLLTKESDVYSFGVVLFEVLCSRHCIDLRYTDQRRSLPILVKKCRKDQTLHMIIDDKLSQQFEQSSSDVFVSLAYECLEKDRTRHPSMASVVRMLETALEYQLSPGSVSTRTQPGPRMLRPEKVHLVHLDRASNCEMVLEGIELSVPEIIDAILELDSFEVSVEQVHDLIKVCPTREEMEMLKRYTGDREMLGQCEQCSKIPRIQSKLKVFSISLTHERQFNDLMESLTTINDTTKEIKGSEKLAVIMQTIGTLENELDAGTSGGLFKLMSFEKLGDTSAENQKITPLHNLCKLTAEQYPEMLDFDKDLIHLEAACGIQITSLYTDNDAIIEGVEKVRQEFSASVNDGDVSAPFREALKRFLHSADIQLKFHTLHFDDVLVCAGSLAAYFGEDPDHYSWEQVIRTLLHFIVKFKKAHDENKQRADGTKKLEEEVVDKDKGIN